MARIPGEIRRELRAERTGVIIGVVVGLLWTAARVSMPKLVEGAIDEGITPRDGAALLRWSAAVAVAAAFAATFTGLRRYWAFKVSRRVEASLREQLFAHIQRLHAGFLDRTSTGAPVCAARLSARSCGSAGPGRRSLRRVEDTLIASRP